VKYAGNELTIPIASVKRVPKNMAAEAHMKTIKVIPSERTEIDKQRLVSVACDRKLIRLSVVGGAFLANAFYRLESFTFLGLRLVFSVCPKDAAEPLRSIFINTSVRSMASSVGFLKPHQLDAPFPTGAFETKIQCRFTLARNFIAGRDFSLV